MNSKVLLGGCLLIVLFVVFAEHSVEARSSPGSPRTPEEIKAHKFRVQKMIEGAEKEELLALEWLMEDMNDEQMEEWKKENPEQAERFEKLSKKYGQ